MTDQMNAGSPETGNTSSVQPSNPTPSAPTQGTPETTQAQPSQQEATQAPNNQHLKVQESVLDAYRRQQELSANRQQTQFAGNQPVFDPYQGLQNLNPSQAQTYGQQTGGPQLPGYEQPQVNPYDPTQAAQFAPPRPGDPDYNNYIEWMVNNPQEYDQYLQERQRSMVQQELRQIQEQQQFEQFVQTKFQEFESEVSSHIKNNYNPQLYENPKAFEAVDWMMQMVSEQLPKDQNGRVFNPETGMYYSATELTDLAVKELRSYAEVLMPIIQQMGQGPQPQIPSNQFVASGNLAAQSYGSGGGDIGQQIAAARAQGNHKLADQLQIQALIGKG